MLFQVKITLLCIHTLSRKRVKRASLTALNWPNSNFSLRPYVQLKKSSTKATKKANWQDTLAGILRNKSLIYYFPKKLKYINYDEALLALFDLTVKTMTSQTKKKPKKKTSSNRKSKPLYLLWVPLHRGVNVTMGHHQVADQEGRISVHKWG